MDRFMLMTIIFMSLILSRLFFLKLFWLHRYWSSGQTCLETGCVGFKPAACVNWSFCLFPPKGRLCSMLWDDRPVQQQNVCSEGDPTEQGVQTTPEGQGTRSPIFVSPVSCITGNQCLGCCLKRLHRLMSCHMLTDYERDRTAQNAVTQACGEILPLFRGPRKHLHLPRAVQSEGETSEL